MPVESYEPNKGSGKYRRIREYKTVNGKQVATYVRYLGKTDQSTTVSIETVKSNIETLNTEIKAYRDKGQDVPAELRQRALKAYTKLDSLHVQLIADEKGERLTKIERGLLESLKPKSYAELTALRVRYIDKSYQDGTGLTKISNELGEVGVSVSPNTIRKYLIDAGIYEMRKFGHARIETDREADLGLKLIDRETEIRHHEFEAEKSRIREIDKDEEIKKLKAQLVEAKK